MSEVISSGCAEYVACLCAAERQALSHHYMALIHSQQFLPPWFLHFLLDVQG